MPANNYHQTSNIRHTEYQNLKIVWSKLSNTLIINLVLVILYRNWMKGLWLLFLLFPCMVICLHCCTWCNLCIQGPSRYIILQFAHSLWISQEQSNSSGCCIETSVSACFHQRMKLSFIMSGFQFIGMCLKIVYLYSVLGAGRPVHFSTTFSTPWNKPCLNHVSHGAYCFELSSSLLSGGLSGFSGSQTSSSIGSPTPTAPSHSNH